MSEDIASPEKGCFPKISNTWRSVIGALTAGNRVHPSDPGSPPNSEFITIESKLKIRVLRLTPENVRQSLLIDHSRKGSISEEYWFLKSKPLRNSSCKCSFRNSVQKPTRNSNASSDSSLQITPGTNTTNQVEEFVERMIKDTFKDTLNQYSKLGEGHENLAFECEEVDSAIQFKTNEHVKKDINTEKKAIPSNPTSCVHHKKIKPLILLIHGLGSTADVWNILMHNLSYLGFEVVAPDLLGHGFSSAPPKACFYQFKNLSSQVISIFDHFMDKDDQRKCILIGHSYGCSLITSLYPRRANRISQLILISGGGPTPLAPAANMNTISPYGWAHNLCYPFMLCGLKRSFFYSSRGKNFKFCEEESTVAPHVKDYLIQGQYWPEGDASFHRRILVPTLLVHGLQDRNVTLVQECEMERTIPRSFLELIPDAGHMSMVESPDHLSHMVNCFLEMWT